MKDSPTAVSATKAPALTSGVPAPTPGLKFKPTPVPAGERSVPSALAASSGPRRNDTGEAKGPSPSAPGNKKRKLSGEKLRAARKAERSATKRAARQAAARAVNEAANPSKRKRPKNPPPMMGPVGVQSVGTASAPAVKRRAASQDPSPRVHSNRVQPSASSRPARPPQNSTSRTPATRIAIAAALAVGLMLVFWVLFRMPAPGPH